MWAKISKFVITYRLYLLIGTGLLTLFMGYQARKLEMTYDFVKVVPQSDPDLQYYNKFKTMFGEDGNILVVGMADEKVFKFDNFVKYKKLTEDLERIPGVNQIISIPTQKVIQKDTTKKRFTLVPLFDKNPINQAQLDSLLEVSHGLHMYDGQLYNSESKATLIAISIDQKILNSPKRLETVQGITQLANHFSKETSIQVHYAGLPYVRAIMIGKVKREFTLFLYLALGATTLILLFFFRTFYSVFFTILTIGITIVFTMGLMALFGYKMTLLSGMLPSIITVISIPNCIYMFNKYHMEYRRHGNKIKAVDRIIEKIGFLTFMTNANTAVGFIVLYFTDIIPIKEFGLIAGIVSFATFLITIAVVPPILIYLPDPKEKHLRHLDFQVLAKIMDLVEVIIFKSRPAVYITMGVLVLISVLGIMRIRPVSYMVDDLPERDNVKTDLVFFETHFKGVMPLEIIIDFGKPKAVYKLNNLKKLEELEVFLQKEQNISPPISVLNIIKGAVQAFYSNNPEYYRLPDNLDKGFIMSYLGAKSGNMSLIHSFMDSTGRMVRFSMKVADLGNVKMAQLMNQRIKPKVAEIFEGKEVDVQYTGTTLLFIKGTQYLIDDLSGSMFYAFILISLMMAMIFTDLKIIVISVIPNVLPIVMTGGVMGLLGIPLKPSTALTFSIAFGISIDSTIHFLSKYKQELELCKGDYAKAVLLSVRESGISMIYTSMVLFFGFVIFTFSEFGGTIALGLLTSLTLFFALFTNLVLLPSLLLSFDKNRAFTQEKKRLFTLPKWQIKERLEEVRTRRKERSSGSDKGGNRLP
jgi:predicted RND superfamily exporter protein